LKCFLNFNHVLTIFFSVVGSHYFLQVVKRFLLTTGRNFLILLIYCRYIFRGIGIILFLAFLMS